MEHKRARAQLCNALICAIATSGRKFLNHNGIIASLEVSDSGHIFFIDAYTRRRIYTHYRGHWSGFSDCGTIRSAILLMHDFIRTGRPLPAATGVFGPWPSWYSDGDPWGYGDDIEFVRETGRRLGIIRRKAEVAQLRSE